MSKEIIYDGSQKIDWNKIGPHHRIKFIIPVGGSKKKWWQFWKKEDGMSAKEQLAELIADYKKDIKLDSTGEMTIVSNQDYFLPVIDKDEVDFTIIIDKNKK